MSEIKKKLSVDIQRLNTSLLQNTKWQKKPSTPNFSVSSDTESIKEVFDYCGKEISDLNEVCMILHWLKILFPKEPEMVNRIILEIQRHFKYESATKTCEDFNYPWKCSQELESLRLYLQNVDKLPAPLGNPKTVNFFDQYHIMKKAGIGMPQEEVFNISMSIYYLLGMSPHISKIRFWGKINGIFRDYYILECDLNEAEIQIRNGKKQEALEKARTVLNNQENQTKVRYLNTDSKNDILKGLGDKNIDTKSINPDVILPEEEGEGEGDLKKFPIHEVDANILVLKNLPSKFITFKMPDRPGIEIVDDWIVPEDDVGSGTNKKIYLVSNNAYNEWSELPNVTPHQIVVARQIKKYFTGVLDHHIETCPCFPGNERNYLRAQIARISASTQISPLGFYHFNVEEEVEEEEEDENEGGVKKPAGCVLNDDYFPMLMAELGGKNSLDFWAHHTEHILKQGRTVFWKPFAAQSGNEGEAGPDENVPQGPEILTPISNDIAVNGIQSWTLSCKSKLFPDSATAVAQSNLWPGATAYAYSTFADTIYLGWGHKRDVYGFTPAQPRFPQQEYEIGPDIVEAVDPSVEFTMAWIDEHSPKGPLVDMLGEGEAEQSPDEDGFD